MKAIASLATVMLLLAGVGLVACGDDDEDSAATEATTTEEAAAGGGGATEIGMTEYAFDPADATVSRGDTITVTNGGELAHNYTVMAGDQSVDEALPPGERHLARQLATTGDVDPGSNGEVELGDMASSEYRVICTIPGHREKGMRGTLTIE
jgi:plastocyanin